VPVPSRMYAKVVTVVLATAFLAAPAAQTPADVADVDLADLDHSFANLATGESGQPLSSHYKDQWDAYYAGRSFPMQYGKVDAKNVLVLKPR